MMKYGGCSVGEDFEQADEGFTGNRSLSAIHHHCSLRCKDARLDEEYQHTETVRVQPLVVGGAESPWLEKP
jgi:hypothetical protein